MKYVLVIDIGFDESNWNLDTFNEDSKEFLLGLLKKYKSFKGRYVDNLGRIEISNGTPEMERVLRAECESRNYIYDGGTLVVFSDKDIKEARFVPFFSAGEVVDFDGGKELNVYEEILCEECGRINDKNVPNPYNVFYKRMKEPRDFFSAMNGIIIISVLAFEILREDIERWVDFGSVKLVDEKIKPVKTDYEYLWIRPKFEIGKFINSKVKKYCNLCKQPSEIRMDYTDKSFEHDWIVESFKNTDAPIVLAGNWFGEFSPEETRTPSRDVFISASLHEKIRKLKLKGFVKADYVIYAADEPRDWDPLKDRSPRDIITGN